MKHRKLSFTFWMVMYVLLGIFAICAVMLVLWKFAEAYEYTQPDTRITAYMDQLNADRWNDAAAAAAAKLVTPFQSDEEKNAEIREYLSNGVEYALTMGSNTENERTFALTVLGKKIGQVVLERDEQADKSFGMLPWRVKDAEMDFSNLMFSKEIVIPGDFSATVNGRPLSNEYIIDSGIPLDCLADYYSVCDSLATKNIYKFDYVSYSTQPDINVLDLYGNDFAIDPALDDSQYLDICSQEALNALSSFAVRFTNLYLTFRAGYVDTEAGETIYDVYNRLGPYFFSGSELQQRVFSACDGLTWAHCYSINISNITLKSAWDIGNSQYIIDITADVTTSDPHGRVDRTESMRCVVADYSGDRRVLYIDEY